MSKSQLMSTDALISGRIIPFEQLSDTHWKMKTGGSTSELKKIPGNLVQCLRPDVLTNDDGNTYFQLNTLELNELVEVLWNPNFVQKLPFLVESCVLPYVDVNGNDVFISVDGTRFLHESAIDLSTGKKARIECMICEASIKRSQMRLHVAWHLVKDDEVPLEKSCGFCGRNNECMVGLVKGTSKNIENIKSNCPAKPSTNVSVKAMKKGSVSNPTTNHPVKCPSCLDINTWIWSYGLNDHYTKHHSDCVMPSDIQVIANPTLDEIDSVKTAGDKLIKKK